MTLSLKQIFHADELQQLEAASETVSVSFRVDAPLDRVWAVMSEHDLMRRKMGLSLIDFTYRPVTEGGSILEGEYRSGLGKVHFFEQPFEWVHGSYSVGRRLFDKGPFRYASLGFYLESIDADHTQVKTEMRLLLQGPLKALILRKMQKSAQDYPTVVAQLVSQVQSPKPPAFEPSLQASARPEDVQRFQKVLSKLEPFHAQIVALADYRARASERFLQRLRPYEIADYYKLPRQNTLAFFLEGTQVGLFSLNWDILCPVCRGAKKQSRSLRELDRKVHCEACGINFEVIDSKDVELSFVFAGDLAVEPAPTYCIGNPSRSPTIHVQIPLAPQESRTLSLLLPGQSYRLRDLKNGQIVRLRVTAKGRDRITRADMEALRPQNEVLVQPRLTVDWDNPSQDWQVLRFDCLDPHEDAATADHVASLPAYRHLFGDDALRPGMQLGVGHLVFLFSDIRGSTQLYRELGDSKAFRLVQDHFALMDEHIRKAGGSIVKTIGDAVMASFLNEEAAITAALAVQNHYASQKQGHALGGLKIALHSGPCIMVNLNDHMDYFGTTVNTCARLLDVAGDEDIVISSSLFQMPKVQAFLAQQNITWIQDEQVLRGLHGSRSFYRLKLLKQIPMRLIS